MSNKFHNKYHRYNHHTDPTPGILDSGKDPIASFEFPFKGAFVTENGNSDQWSSTYSTVLANSAVWSVSADIFDADIFNADFLLLSGGVMSGNIDMSGNCLVNVCSAGIQFDDTTIFGVNEINEITTNINTISGDLLTFLLSDKILIVDESAVPNTGERGNLTKPFHLVYEAVDAAQPGDTIIVRPGIHYMRNQIGFSLAKPGIHIHFMSGCKVYYGYTVFNSTSDEWVNAPDLTLPFRCSGHAEFINYSDAVFKRLSNSGQTGGGSNPGVVWDLEFLSYDSTSTEVTSTTGPLDQAGNPITAFNSFDTIFFQDVTGTHNVKIKCHRDIIANNRGINFQSLNGGSLSIVCRDFITAQSEAVSVRNIGAFTLYARNIISSGSLATIRTVVSAGGNPKRIIAESIQNSNGPAINIGHGGQYYFNVKKITGTNNSTILNSSTANILIENATIVCGSNDHPAIARNTASGSLTLKNCHISSEDDYSIDSNTSTSVNFQSTTYGTKPLGPTVNPVVDTLLTPLGIPPVPLGNYLPLSGGILTGTLKSDHIEDPIILNNPSSTDDYSALVFSKQDTPYLEIYGLRTENDPNPDNNGDIIGIWDYVNSNAPLIYFRRTGASFWNVNAGNINNNADAVYSINISGQNVISIDSGYIYHNLPQNSFRYQWYGQTGLITELRGTNDPYYDIRVPLRLSTYNNNENEIAIFNANGDLVPSTITINSLTGTNYLPLSGGVMSGNIDMSGDDIININSTLTDTLTANNVISKTLSINPQSGSYNVQSLDMGRTITMFDTDPNAVIIQDDATLDVPINSSFTVIQSASGITGIVGGTGVSINGAIGGSVLLGSTGATLAAVKVAPNSWLVTNSPQTLGISPSNPFEEVYLRSPDDSIWKLTINNSGNMTTEPSTLPWVPKDALYFKSPDETVWKLSVTNDGNILTE